MRVLITGGYGFIGSHVADRFYKEGYDIFIIDNLSTGKKENIIFKHKSYELSVEDPKCKQIFESYHFDVVVHLAAQVSVKKSIENPSEDTSSNILGLVNMLNLANKYKVKKFIFASSAAVYGLNDKLPLTEQELCQPISPYGISKWVGESYCQKWHELYDFESICFRFSNVYGPRQSSNGEGGVISTFITKSIQNETLRIHGDGGQTRDFIYVTDVAFAIYRAANGIISGVYNLSTNTETSVNDIVECLRNFQDDIEIEHSNARSGDIYHSVLSNEKLKKHIDWSPMYSIEQGLTLTYKWALDTQEKEEEKKPVTKAIDKESNGIIQWLKPYIENLVVFSIVAWFILNDYVSFMNSMDIGIFYIMIIGVIYGNRQSIFAVGLSVGLVVMEKLSEGREFVSLLYDTLFFFQISLFLFVGLVVGYSIQRKNNMLVEQKQQVKDFEKRFNFLNDIHTEIREVKDELQMRLLNSEDSFGKIHSIVKELDNLEPEKVFFNTVTVVQKIMNADNVSIYMLNKSQTFLRLIANTSSGDTIHSNSMKVESVPYIQSILKNGSVYVNKSLVANAPLMAAPIYHNNTIAAIITIDDMKFENFSAYHENLFKVTADLVESALGRALNYIDATEDKRYVPNTRILKRSVFKEILDSKIDAKIKYNMPFVLLASEKIDSSIEEYSKKVFGLLRETDYIGQFNRDEIVVLLSNTTQDDVKTVLKRFNNEGINMELAEVEV